MAETLGQGLKRFLRDASRWRSVRDSAHNLLKAATTADPWIGSERTFEMIHEVTPDNPQIPTEVKVLARRAPDILEELRDPFAAYINSLIARDMGNVPATADIVNPDNPEEVWARNVPAISLMAMNKDAGEWVALINDAPVAPAGENWRRDPETRALVSDEKLSLRSQRVRRAIKIADATDRHPAQYVERDEDVPTATISTKVIHGGLLASEKRVLLAAAQRYQLAISQALELANAEHQTTDVTGVGEALVRAALPRVESL